MTTTLSVGELLRVVNYLSV